MAKGKQIGEFSLKSTSQTVTPGPAGSTLIQGNFEGTGTGAYAGTSLSTLTAVGGKSGTVSWCGTTFLDNGDQLSATASGTYESSGKHRWRVQLFAQLPDGVGVISEGEIDLATRSWTGKLFENT